MQAQVVVVLYSRVQMLTAQIAKATARISQAYPIDAGKILSWTRINSQHTRRIDSRIRRESRGWSWRWRASHGRRRNRGRASYYSRRGKLTLRCIVLLRAG